MICSGEGVVTSTGIDFRKMPEMRGLGRALAQLDNTVLHTALRDVIASNDARASEALDYL